MTDEPTPLNPNDGTADDLPLDARQIATDRALCRMVADPDRMRHFLRVTLPRGIESSLSRYDLSAYLPGGQYVRLVPGMGKVGDVVGPDGTIEGNVMTLLRVLSIEHPSILPPIKALAQFMGLLEIPLAWTDAGDAEAAGIWAEQVELDLSDKHIIDGWLYRDSITVLYGQRSTYKSFAGMSMTLAAAYGLPTWFGRDVQRCGVIYVAAEGGDGVKKRLRAFQIYHGLDSKVPVPFMLVPRQINLGDPRDVAFLIRVIKRAQAERDLGLLALDTLARSMRGLNENSAMDVALFLDGVEAVRKATGVGVMIIAHAGKDLEAGARGSSLIEADVDAVIRLARSEQDRTVTATVVKLKDEKDGDTLTLAFHSVEVGESPMGRIKTSGVLVEAVGAIPGAAIRLRPASRTLLDALRECVINRRQEVTVRPLGVPSSKSVPLTLMKHLREEFGKRRGFTTAKWTAKQADAFEAARNELIDKKMMAAYGEYVWLYRAAEMAPEDPEVVFALDEDQDAEED